MLVFLRHHGVHGILHTIIFINQFDHFLCILSCYIEKKDEKKRVSVCVRDCVLKRTIEEERHREVEIKRERGR